jgi:beta-carotene ketolase (CrtO type)
MVDVFTRYAPDTAALIVDRAVTTPADRQAITGNLNGNPFQLDMSLDQSLRFRPVPGLAEYETPVGGLYLTGSGTHPGGGVTGVPGYNAAHVILQRADRTGRRQRAGVERTVRQLRQAASMYRAWRELRKVV